MMSAAVYGVYVSSTRTATSQNALAGAQQNVRGGIELMAQDIRMAGYNPNQVSNLASIEISDAGKIRVTSDRNENGTIDESHFERISYELVGNELRRILYESTGSESSQTIINNVADLQFSYSGVNNSIVDILLTVEENAGFGSTVSRTLQTRVYCRNLGNN